MELNVEKIEKELEKIDRTRSWLARQIGVQPQNVKYWLQARSIKGAPAIARVLGLKPESLIKF